MTVFTPGAEDKIHKVKRYPVENVICTDVGPVYIEGPVEREKLEKLFFAEGLSNFRPPGQQKKALEMLAEDEDGLVFIARHEHTIIGYATFHNPDFPWWQNTGIEELMELGGLEIDPDWRNSGVASGLFKALFGNEQFDFFEDKIVMNIQTVHCWDIRRSGFSIWEYRELMRGMLEKFGFYVQSTNDPEVREHGANMLMVRIGKHVEKEAAQEFLDICFGKQRCF